MENNLGPSVQFSTSLFSLSLKKKKKSSLFCFPLHITVLIVGLIDMANTNLVSQLVRFSYFVHVDVKSIINFVRPSPTDSGEWRFTGLQDLGSNSLGKLAGGERLPAFSSAILFTHYPLFLIFFVLIF